MDTALKTYLARHATLEKHTLEWISPAPASLEIILVIPILAEYPGILETLNDLAANAEAWKSRTLIITVLNNRDPAHTSPGDIENNLECMNALRNFPRSTPNFHPLSLALIDASSPGCELGPKEGVGHARKLGMDWGAKLLGEAGRMNAPLVCLDADTRVNDNYLDAIGSYFQAKTRWGVVIDYAHPKIVDAPETPGILAYELYLRYCELGMLYAGSPYAYHAIGSAMACSARAYVASGGMKRRAAAEDFYFLQALAKTGRIEHIWDTTVHPSARCSHRAPIGTGKHMSDFLRDSRDAYTVYHPEAYQTLRFFFTEVQTSIQAVDQTLTPSLSTKIHELQNFLNEIGFAETWSKIMSATPNKTQRLRQFHTRFDALQSLRAIHHLHDNGLTKIDSLTAIRRLMELMQGETSDASKSTFMEIIYILDGFSQKNWKENHVKQEALLVAMRNLARKLAQTAGLDKAVN